MLKDKIDEKILEFLKSDSRESFVEIGKKLKLSESAVRRRVKNLVDRKVIERFTIEMGEIQLLFCLPNFSLFYELQIQIISVRRRVKNLVDRKVIERFTIEMGEINSTSAIVLISVDSTTDTSKVSSKLTKLTAVKTVYEITGQYDISVIIRAPNITEINSAIDELRKIPGVIDTNTVIILRTIR